MSTDLITADNQAALDFLRLFEPEGPWVLMAIDPVSKKNRVRTFRPQDEASLLGWLDAVNGSWNVYFHVNPPLRDMRKKAELQDIKEVRWLHVDIDPRRGEDLTGERARILALLTRGLPEGVPAPSIIIFSGGGYQCFWRLKTPVAVNGNVELARDAARYNQRLQALLGGDNCHNVDRVMRVPGTINVPDEKKKKSGRVRALASLLEYNAALVYDIAEFTPAPAIQGSVVGAISANSTKHRGDQPHLSSVDELDKWHVPDRIKMIIRHGRHPAETKARDDSRSAWLFDALCHLVRCNVDDEVILSIIIDPKFLISTSVLEQGHRAERYAIRQIERAKEEVIDPSLRELNDQFTVIASIGGKCRVIYEETDPILKRSRLVRQGFQDFENRYRHRRVQVGITANGQPIEKLLGKWWLDHPQRRQFDRIVFAPGQEEIPGAYNLWRGFAVAARPGNGHELFLKHVRDNVCQGDEEQYKYVLGWMARVIQRPAEPGEVAVVLRGGKGVGKSFFAKQLGRLLGRHFIQVSNPSHLVGNFNAHLRDAVLLFADEAFYAGDKKHGSILKTLITEETIQIEAKGVDVEPAPNFVHLIMASNDDHVVRASGDERRFCVLDVGRGQQQQESYFGTIASRMENGGYENLLYFLMEYDLSGYEVRRVPQTAALRDQKENTIEGFERLVFETLKSGELPFVTQWLDQEHVGRTRPFIMTSRLQQWAEERLRQQVTLKSIGDLLSLLGCKNERKGARGWVIPPLAEMRAQWDQEKFKAEWDEADIWSVFNVASF